MDFCKRKLYFFFQGVNLLKQASELWEEAHKLEEEALWLETEGGANCGKPWQDLRWRVSMGS